MYQVDQVKKNCAKHVNVNVPEKTKGTKQIRVSVLREQSKNIVRRRKRRKNTNEQSHDKTQLQCNEQTQIKRTQRLKLHPRKRVNV